VGHLSTASFLKNRNEVESLARDLVQVMVAKLNMGTICGVGQGKSATEESSLILGSKPNIFNYVVENSQVIHRFKQKKSVTKNSKKCSFSYQLLVDS